MVTCAHSKDKCINLIIYTDFFNPLKTYKNLKEDLVNTGYIDSMKVIGRPLYKPEIVVQFDTVKVIAYGFDIDTIAAITADSIISVKNIHDIQRIMFRNKSGFMISLSEISVLLERNSYYEPDIFLPDPKVYYYKGRSAVKLQLYYKKAMKKKLIEYIHGNIQNHSDALNLGWDGYGFDKIEYEIIDRNTKIRK